MVAQEGSGDPARNRVLIKSDELEISTRKNGGLKNSVLVKRNHSFFKLKRSNYQSF